MTQHIALPQVEPTWSGVVTDTPLFIRIQIQTVSWCNRSCAFCPSGKFPVDKTFMPLAVYHRVIDHLHDLQFNGRISPYLMNEPLLDKRLPDLLAYTRERCPDSWIAINTNGDALSAALAYRLFDAGLNCLDVNAYDNPAQYQEYVALAERIAAPRRDITHTTGYLDPTFNTPDLPRDMRVLHCRDMTDWETRFHTQEQMAGLTNRSGNVPGARCLSEPLALSCERPFVQMYINYHGQAVLCCNDWRFEVIMGDTATSSLTDIWTNAKYRAYRDNLRRKNRAMPLCATCDYQLDATDGE